MKRKTAERLAYGFAVAAVTTAAAGAVLARGDLEVTFFMVSAVIAGLICFDTSMDRHARSFLPWVLLSLAPAAKTVPTVWFVLNSERGLSQERWDHIGSLLFGAFVLAATWTLSRPSKLLGRATSGLDGIVVIGAALTAGMAGASVAFLFDSDFGSETSQRVIESLSWVVVGGLIASTALSAARTPKITAPLLGVLGTAAATAGLLAYTVAGREIDRGWWAVLFAALTWSAGAFGLAALGEREGRTRESSAAPWVAGLAGAVAAAAAISARGDRTAWSTGWILLGVVSLGLFALALLWPSGETYEEVEGEVDIDEAIAQARAKESALGTLRQASASSAAQSRSVEEPAGRELVSTGPAARSKELPADQRVAVPAARIEPMVPVEPPVPEPLIAEKSSPVEPLVRAESPVPPLPDLFVAEPPLPVEPPLPEPAVAETPPPVEPPAPVEPPVPESVVAKTPPVEQPAPVELPEQSLPGTASPQPFPAQTPLPEPAAPVVPARPPRPAQPAIKQAEPPARAAASAGSPPPRPRPQPQPNPFYVPAAHHLDPSTGLLSAAGLQEMIVRGFDTPPHAGRLTVMMLSIRDLDEIEATHGRLSAAAVTREVAQRLQTLLPDGTGARFSRAAYAVVFVDLDEAPNKTVERLARALKRMRVPVADSGSPSEIDVVAGMAQCYEGEDAASFIRRGNYGLAKAVKSPEPTFVAMP